jgi:hypothetical protein
MGLDSAAQALHAAEMDIGFGAARQQNIAAMQTQLAQSMREIFFRQMRLINAMTVELPLGWISGGADAATDSHGSLEETQSKRDSFLPSPSFETIPPTTEFEEHNRDLAPSTQSDVAPVVQSKALRKNIANRRKSLS